MVSNDSNPDFPNSTLNSNGSRTVNATINIPSVTSGTYYIIAYADAPTALIPAVTTTKSMKVITQHRMPSLSHNRRERCL